MKIIVGLGNPGKSYEKTRHNLGFMILDSLAQEKGLTWQTNQKFKSEICKFDDLLLVKPQTFMNNSGQAVQAVLSYYKLLPKTLGLMTKKDSELNDILTVIHDDIDVDFGKYKISTNSRSAGHKGIQSIIDHLKTKNFNRIRFGVRTEAMKNIPAPKFVLQKFNQQEMEDIKKMTPEIARQITGNM